MIVATETETAMDTVVENDGVHGHLVIETQGRLGVKWKWIPIRRAAIIELASVKTDTLGEIIVMSEDGIETEARGATEEIGEIEVREVREVREVVREVREATEATEE